MRELDVSSLNKKSPYAVEMRSDYAQKEIFYVEHVEIEAEGVMNFAAIIVQKSNPCLETIIADFRSAIDELQKPN